MPVFQTRPTVVGISTGLLVAATFGLLIGAPWGLAVLNGLAGGGLVLLVSYASRLGRLRLEVRTAPRPLPAVWPLGLLIMQAPVVFLWMSTELDFASELALSVLLALTGLAAYLCGDVVATLEHRDGDHTAG